MRRQIVAVQKQAGRRHVERRGLCVCGDLQQTHPLQQFRGRHRPADPQRRNQHLGKAAQVNHPPFGIHRFQCRQVRSGKADMAIGRVFNHDDIMGIRQLDQPPAPGQGQGDPGRVLEIRHGIDHPGARIGAQHGFQHIGLQALSIHRHRGIGGLAGVEGDQRPQKGGVFRHDHIAGVDQHPRGKIQALLRSLQDQHILGPAGGAVPYHQRRDLFAQARQTVGRRILHRRPAGGADHLAEHRLQLCGREKRCIRIAAAKGNDRRIGPQRQQFPDGRGLHPVHPTGKARRHAILPNDLRRNGHAFAAGCKTGQTALTSCAVLARGGPTPRRPLLLGPACR